MINIGNDELILRIRKNYQGCQLNNAQLGKLINEWINQNVPEASIIEHHKPCHWDKSQSNLPETAAEYSFPEDQLASLYNQLEIIAN